MTVDRHEWYAPPQIYTRDDSTGLWTAKPALPPDSVFLSAGINHHGEGLLNQAVVTNTCVTNMMEDRPQDNNHELADGLTVMETSQENVSEETQAHDEPDVGTKKRRIEEDSSTDGIVSADCSLHESTEEKLENVRTTLNAVLRDNHGAAANASISERVIEPTLVMFEVIYRGYA